MLLSELVSNRIATQREHSQVDGLGGDVALHLKIRVGLGVVIPVRGWIRLT